METRASYVLIGGFAFGAMVLALLFVLWLAKSSLDREFDEYDIVFTEAVTGLSVAGAVQYNGIQIGAVKKLSLDPRDPRRVIAHVRVAAGTPVKADTRAKLTFTGLTGVAIIQLTDGTPQSPPLVAKEGEAWPTIVADDSALQKLMVSSEDMLANMTESVARLSQLLSEDNLAHVSDTLAHIDTVTGELAEGRGDLGSAIRNLSDASATLKTTLARADALVAKLDAATASAGSLIDGGRLGHRDLHRPRDRDRLVALVGRAVADPHRQGPRHDRDRGGRAVQGAAAPAVRGRRRASHPELPPLPARRPRRRHLPHALEGAGRGPRHQVHRPRRRRYSRQR